MFFPLLLFALLAACLAQKTDIHGCCTSCGETWCSSSSACVSDWAQCDGGSLDTTAGIYSWKNLQFSLLDILHKTYFVQDSVQRKNLNYTYAFSVLSNVNLNKLPGGFPEACKETKGPGEEAAVSSESPAFQMVSSSYLSDICYRTGSEISTQKVSDGISAGLIDPVKPASGWYLRYTGGNTCDDEYTSKDLCPFTYHSKGTTYCERSLRINWICHNVIQEVPATVAIRVSSGCNYEIDVNSIYGCPLECPRNGGTNDVCSGNGLCFYSGFDGGETTSGETGVPSCACEEGYSGDACEYDLSATTTSSSGVAVTMSESVSLASLFLFIAVFGLTVFACVKREKTISCLSGIINLLQNRQYDDLGPYNNSGRQQSRGGMFSMEFSSDSQTTKKQSSSSRPFHSYTPISAVGDDGYNYSTVPSFTSFQEGGSFSRTGSSSSQQPPTTSSAYYGSNDNK